MALFNVKTCYSLQEYIHIFKTMERIENILGIEKPKYKHSTSWFIPKAMLQRIERIIKRGKELSRLYRLQQYREKHRLAKKGLLS